MAEYDAIIIGAGHNGMTLAGYLAKAGMSVLVLERKMENGGGLCTEEPITPGIYHNIHSNFHYYIEMPPYQDLELESYGARYIYPEVQYGMPYSDGKCLTIYRSGMIEKSVKAIERFSKKDAETFRKMYDLWAVRNSHLLRSLTYNPPVPPDELDKKLKGEQRELLKFGQMTPEQAICETFEDEHIRTLVFIMLSEFCLSHDSKGMGIFFPFFFERFDKGKLCVGGSHNLAHAMGRMIITHGSMILEQAEVDSIIIKNDIAVGVRLVDGREFGARKLVASSIDPKQTFLRFIKEEKLPGDYVKRIKNWEWEEWSIFGLHLDLREPPNYSASKFDPDMNMAMMYIQGVDTVKEMVEGFEQIRRGLTCEKPFGNGHCNSRFDRSMTIRTYHTAQWWGIFAPFDLKDEGAEGWDEMKEDYGKLVLEKWREYAPNLKESNILGTYVYSPLDIERNLINMVRGGQQMGALIDEQLFNNRLDYRTPVKNLYLCGSCTHPSGNITFAPGYNAANVIAEDLKIKKWWQPKYLL